MTIFGWSRATLSASAMPSISGMRMSVSSRSKLPFSRVRMSSASAPSNAVTTVCPRSVIARATRARSGSSSSATKIRAIVISSWSRRGSAPSLAENRLPLFLASLLTLLNHADERQLPECVGHVHAVADDEEVGTDKTDEIGIERDRALAGLFQQHAGEYAVRAARRQQVLGESERTPGFEDVIDQHDVASAHVAFHVVQDRHGPGRGRALAIARQRNKLDLG